MKRKPGRPYSSTRKSKNLHVRLKPDTHDWLLNHARGAGRTVSECIIRLIEKLKGEDHVAN